MEELAKLIENYKVVALSDLYKVKTAQIQELRKRFGDEVKFRCVKNTLARFALKKVSEKKPGVEKLEEYLKGSNLFIFTNISPFKLSILFEKNKINLPASAGDVAPEDIVVPEGNTGMSPGPVISELSDVGLPTKIESGSIWITRDTVVARKGDIIESDLAGIHILDLESGEYNIPFLKRSSAGMKLYLIRGYMRLQGFVTRDRLSYSEVLDGLRNGRLRFMNRNPGSGTRLLIDYVLGRELGNEFKEIKGYNDYVNSHLEVASKVAEGIADVGVCIEYCAKYYNLNFIPLKWEYFDFVTKDEIEKPVYQEIISILKSEEFRNKLKDFPGYKIASDTGKVIEIA